MGWDGFDIEAKLDRKKKIAIYCPQGSGTLRQQLTILHYLALYCSDVLLYPYGIHVASRAVAGSVVCQDGY